MNTGPLERTPPKENNDLFTVVDYQRPPGKILKYNGDRIVSTQEAIQVSIEKWRTLNALCAQGVVVHDGGVKTCALCSLFYYGHQDECEDCPINLAGHSGCEGTPCKDYEAAVKQADLNKALQASSDEIFFLERMQHGA